VANLNRRISDLEKKAEAIDLKSQVKFFDSYDEYMEALQKNKIRPHDICLIDDVPYDDG